MARGPGDTFPGDTRSQAERDDIARRWQEHLQSVTTPIPPFPAPVPNAPPAPVPNAPSRSVGLKAGGAILAPFAINNARPGGLSSVEGVSDEMSRRFGAMVAAMPPEIRARVQIISGFRSPERNIDVYRQLGLPPSKNSRHSHGAAMDLGNDPVVLDWIDKNPQHGLGFPLKHMKGEQNHLEMIDQLGGRVAIGGAPAGRPEFGGGSDAAPVYAETGDPQFKSGLATPTSTVEAAPDPARQAALAALALQQTPGPPGSTGFGGPGSLGDAFGQAVKAGQPPVQPPSTILGAPSYANVGGPIPLARRIG